MDIKNDQKKNAKKKRLVGGRLGVVLSRLKTDVKIDQIIDAFWDRFLVDFPPKLAPKIDQNPGKIDAKMPSHVDFLF